MNKAKLKRLDKLIEDERNSVSRYRTCTDGSYECALSTETLYFELLQLQRTAVIFGQYSKGEDVV